MQRPWIRRARVVHKVNSAKMSDEDAAMMLDVLNQN